MTVKDKIHKIKESRLSPAEKFLYSIFWNLKEYYSNKHPDSVFYKKDDEILFEYEKKNGIFLCHYYKIWLVLESDYGLKNQEIRELIKNKVWETLNLKEATPLYVEAVDSVQVWKSLKIKELNGIKR